MTEKHKIERSINLNLTIGQGKTSKTTRDLHELAPEPAIPSCDFVQRLSHFNSCQLTIIWMSIIKLNTGFILPQQLESLTFHIDFPVVQTDGRTVT